MRFLYQLLQNPILQLPPKTNLLYINFNQPIPILNCISHHSFLDLEKLSSLLLSGNLRGMPSSGPDEGLKGCTLRVDAQWYSFPLLMLCYETMDELFALPDRE